MKESGSGMNFWEFLSVNPIMTLLLALIIGFTLTECCSYLSEAVVAVVQLMSQK